MCELLCGNQPAPDGSYGYLRQFTPQVLDAVTFADGTAAADLFGAVAVLRELAEDSHPSVLPERR